MFHQQISAKMPPMNARTLRKQFVLFILVVIMTGMAGVFLPAQAAKGAADAFQQANNAYIELSSDPVLHKDKANWLKVVGAYEKVVKTYPQSAYASRALYMKGKLYEQIYGYFARRADINEALAAYDAVVNRYPESSIADDALYKKAKVYENKLSDRKMAIEVYRQIVTQFPHGDMAQQARETLNTFNIEADAGDNGGGRSSAKTAAAPKKNNAAASGPVMVKSIREWSDNDYTRIVVEVGQRASFETFTLPADSAAGKSMRLVMDVKDAHIAKGVPSTLEVNDGILSKIRVSQYQKDKVRIVMDMSGRGSYKAFPLENPSRIVLDVRTKPESKSARAAKTEGATAALDKNRGFKRVRSRSQSQVSGDMPSIAKQLSLKVSRIVIDPGHGGKDPGAIGPKGEREKEITLNVGKRLAKRLKDEGFTIFMTREKDVFVPLEERTAFANKRKADLFVSVHVNAAEDTTIHGLETYFLNLTSDASSIQVAARENATTSKSLSDLQYIINDLMLTSKINESSRFATSTQKSILQSIGGAGHNLKDLGVKQAPFYVLMGAQMPSILVEIGFISNDKECELLKDCAYQDTIIDGIISGINAYVNNTSYVYSGRDE